MLYSTVGKEGAKSTNNIGTYYDLQVITYSLFVGNHSLAKAYINNTTLNRLAAQFGSNGSQPLELKRTKSWTYCIKNLKGWYSIASVSEKVGYDIWNYSTSDGKGLKKATLWMLPYAAAQSKWVYGDISGVNSEWFLPIARIAYVKYQDEDLKHYLSKFASSPAHQREVLTQYHY
jgi:hypothetical protein